MGDRERGTETLMGRGKGKGGKGNRGGEAMVAEEERGNKNRRKGTERKGR
jgi:hypothetical protein